MVRNSIFFLGLLLVSCKFYQKPTSSKKNDLSQMSLSLSNIQIQKPDEVMFIDSVKNLFGLQKDPLSVGRTVRVIHTGIGDFVYDGKVWKFDTSDYPLFKSEFNALKPVAISVLNRKLILIAFRTPTESRVQLVDLYAGGGYGDPSMTVSAELAQMCPSLKDVLSKDITLTEQVRLERFQPDRSVITPSKFNRVALRGLNQDAGCLLETDAVSGGFLIRQDSPKLTEIQGPLVFGSLDTRFEGQKIIASIQGAETQTQLPKNLRPMSIGLDESVTTISGSAKAIHVLAFDQDLKQYAVVQFSIQFPPVTTTTIAPVGLKPFAQPSLIYGPEFEFKSSDPKSWFNNAYNECIKYGRLAQKNIKKCSSSAPYHLKVELINGPRFELQGFVDDVPLEIISTPMTLLNWRLAREAFDALVFKVAGPAPRCGGTHLNTSVQTGVVASDQLIFQRFVAYVYSNPVLFSGLLRGATRWAITPKALQFSNLPAVLDYIKNNKFVPLRIQMDQGQISRLELRSNRSSNSIDAWLENIALVQNVVWKNALKPEAMVYDPSEVIENLRNEGEGFNYRGQDLLDRVAKITSQSKACARLVNLRSFQFKVTNGAIASSLLVLVLPAVLALQAKIRALAAAHPKILFPIANLIAIDISSGIFSYGSVDIWKVNSSSSVQSIP